MRNRKENARNDEVISLYQMTADALKRAMSVPLPPKQKLKASRRQV
jgi:hypothetical protein